MPCYPKVAETMADALGCDVEDVKPKASLIEGLDAESIDFLDMVFRLERTFKMKIPRGKIVENARGDLPEAEFEQKGIVTEKGLAQLRTYLSEVPAERFKTPMKVPTFRGCSRPRRSPSSSSARSARRRPPDGRTSFPACRRRISPRIRSSIASPSSRRRSARAARSRCRQRCRRFSSCLVAEAVGQLAAWVAMDTIDFRGRPVAALATETRFHGDALPGHALDLAVEIDECDDDAVAYSGAASAGGCRVIELDRLPGPDAAGRRISIRRRRCASASRCCAAAAPRRAASTACDARARQSPTRVPGSRGARRARRARSGAVLRRPFSAARRVSRRRCCWTPRSGSRSISRAMRTGAPAARRARCASPTSRCARSSLPGQRLELGVEFAPPQDGVAKAALTARRRRAGTSPPPGWSWRR